MSTGFQNRYVHEEEIPLPPERSTGLVFAAVATIIAAIWFASPFVFWPAATIGTAFAAVSLLAPSILAPLNRAWFAFGLFLNKIVSPVVMFILFATVMVPAGLIMRLFRDPMQASRTSERSSYWLTRDPEVQRSASMNNQF